MNKTISFFLFLFLLCVTSTQSFAQISVKKDDVLNKIFWLNVAIPSFSKCKRMISTDGIYSPKEYCTYLHDTYDVNKPVSSGNKIKIVYLGKRKKWTKIKFEELENDSKHSVTIFLKGDSQENLSKLFNIIFSNNEIKRRFNTNCEKGISKLELFKCWGFPSSITKKDKQEIYTYGLEFGGEIHGFDIATVYIENNKVITIGGII